MSEQPIANVLAQIIRAGLTVSLAPTGGLAVSVSSQLTDDLRELICNSKALLINYLTAAKDVARDPEEWKELAMTNYKHHFKCPTFIACGRGGHYGQSLCKMHHDSDKARLEHGGRERARFDPSGRLIW